MRVGIGYASLPFDPARVLVLGGVKVPGAWGLRGRVDGDALLHALADALLGAAALGDLDEQFPADALPWQAAPSAVLLADVVARLETLHLEPAHVDATVVCERPLLAPHRAAMRERIAALLSLDVAHVSVKATRPNGLGALGDGQGIAVMAVASLAEASA